MLEKRKKISDEELPVVFFLAHKAGVKSSVIINLRLRGKSWFEISSHYNLSPDIYFIDLKTNPGPPYGKAYGHYKKHDANQIKRRRVQQYRSARCPGAVTLADLRYSDP